MTTLPSLFISHGAPTFAIEPGVAGAQLRALGQALAALAKDGVLIIGSGSLTHNLHEFRTGEVQAASYVQVFSGWDQRSF